MKKHRNKIEDWESKEKQKLIKAKQKFNQILDEFETTVEIKVKEYENTTNIT